MKVPHFTFCGGPLEHKTTTFNHKARKIAWINGARVLSLDGRRPVYLVDIQTTRPPPYLTINSRLSAHDL